MIVLTDLLRNPIDEGAKKSTFNIIKQLRLLNNCYVVSVNSDSFFDIVDKYYRTNKTFLSLNLIRMLKKLPYKVILYVPESSFTLATLIRAGILKFLTGKRIFVLAFQPRRFKPYVVSVLRFFKPKCVFVQSSVYAEYLTSNSFDNHMIPMGVDLDKFKPVDLDHKLLLRRKYGITEAAKVVLHVGHIRPERNLDWLMKIKDIFSTIEVIVVGSTYSTGDQKLQQDLKNKGIIVIREYIPDIHEIYQLSDYYVFPVRNDQAAIGTPLSVLEAMACNLAVFSTKFGSLPDILREDEGIYFVENADELIDAMAAMGLRHGQFDNRSKIAEFSWLDIAVKIVECV